MRIAGEASCDEPKEQARQGQHAEAKTHKDRLVVEVRWFQKACNLLPGRRIRRWRAEPRSRGPKLMRPG
jgi:hypothetical protein